MNTYPYQNAKPADPDPGPKPCVDCDLSGFDSVNCEVDGVSAEAEYLKQYRDKFKTRRTQFDASRTAYDKARLEVAADRDLIDQKLKRLKEQLDCQLNQAKRTCLDNAWKEVAQKLEKCGGEQGCCVNEEECTFTIELGEHPTLPEIRALIEDFERRVTAAEDCFDKVLFAEPVELKKRVLELKDFVGKLEAAASDTKTTDYGRVFAELLWAGYRLDKVWLGFDTASSYVDCLCIALNCTLNGRRALAKLTGMWARLQCEEKGVADRCTWLKANVVDEILAVCRRICPPDQAQSPAQSSPA